ncbi:MAG: hypothetical protein ACLPJW_21165, partial [Rhodomicrobium sp.]
YCDRSTLPKLAAEGCGQIVYNRVSIEAVGLAMPIGEGTTIEGRLAPTGFHPPGRPKPQMPHFGLTTIRPFALARASPY